MPFVASSTSGPAVSSSAPSVQTSSIATSSIITLTVQTSSGSQSQTVSSSLTTAASTGSQGSGSLPASTSGPAVSSPAPPVQTSSSTSVITSTVQTTSGSQSQTVSPALTSAASGSSGSAPNLFLTPSPGLQRTRRSTAASASPVGRNVRPRLLTRSASVAPAMPSGQRFSRSPNDPGNRKCQYCLRVYFSHAELNRHLRQARCIFEFRPSDHNIADYCVLRRPPNYNQIAVILSQLTIMDKIKMCRLNSWAIPGLWPLVFPGNLRQRRQTPVILTEMTAAGESTSILNGLLRSEARVDLPKQIILIDEASHIKSVLPTQLLTPGTSFVSRIAGDQLLVSSGNAFF